MMEEHLLSICIPTYNNADCLKECLENILPQAQPYSIPIFVSDNASPDDTIEILSEFQKEYPLLYFRRNSKNLGLNRNTADAMQMASSQYVWIFSNRRRLLPDAVSKVYDLLVRFRPDLLLLNNDSSAMRNASASMKTYRSLRDVFLQAISSVGTYGLQVLPTKAWKPEYMKRYLEDERYKGCVLYCTFDYLASLSTINVVFFGAALVSTAHKWGSWWTDRHFEMWRNVKNSINALPNLAEEDKRVILKSQASEYFSAKKLLFLRAKGIYGKRIFNLYAEDFVEYGSPTLGNVVSEVPIRFLRLYYSLYSLGRGSLRLFIHANRPINPLNRR
jgi:glycosyltransferase involved in cell wall biosynthesis